MRILFHPAEDEKNLSLKQSWCFRGLQELMDRDDVENCLGVN